MLSQSFSAHGEGNGGPLQGKLQPDRAVSVQIKSEQDGSSPLVSCAHTLQP